MLYCTKCKSICEDSTQTCPNCKRSRGLRPVKPEDEVFFLKVSEGEAAELALLFEQNAVRHAIHPVKGGFSTSVYDPEYLPTDKDIYVEYQDLERAKELMLKEREEQRSAKRPRHTGGVCTMCNSDLLFSHRVTRGKRGSNAGFLMLREQNA